MNQPAQLQSWRRQGRTAYLAGQRYEANPWQPLEQPQARLAWSQGHNAAHVQRIMEGNPK